MPSAQTFAQPNCSELNWSDLEHWIAPYISDSVATAFIMLAHSAEYDLSYGADEALAITRNSDGSSRLPETIQNRLLKLSQGQCP